MKSLDKDGILFKKQLHPLLKPDLTACTTFHNLVGGLAKDPDSLFEIKLIFKFKYLFKDLHVFTLILASIHLFLVEVDLFFFILSR